MFFPYFKGIIKMWKTKLESRKWSTGLMFQKFSSNFFFWKKSKKLIDSHTALIIKWILRKHFSNTSNLFFFWTKNSFFFAEKFYKNKYSNKMSLQKQMSASKVREKIIFWHNYFDRTLVFWRKICFVNFFFEQFFYEKI